MLFLIVFISLLANNANGLLCYSCKNCSEPFTEYTSGVDIIDCTSFISETYGDFEDQHGPLAQPICAKISITYNYVTIIKRSCELSYYEFVPVSGIEKSFCLDKDFCNSSKDSRLSSSLLAFIIFTASFYQSNII